ncbi:MAG TPA: hypothetical protein VFX76_04895, partial [Roseiflexaceae bacterium]|nr:hypothetical protein [Roseiflexaceae bacterium]
MHHRFALRSVFFALLVGLVLAACVPAPTPVPTFVPAPSPPTAIAAPAPSATVAIPTATVVPSPEPTTIPLPTAAPTKVVLRSPYEGPLDLVAAELPLGDCEQRSPLELPSQGVVALSFAATGVCGNGEIGLLEPGGRQHVALAGLGSAAFVLFDVEDPTAPQRVGAWKWRQPAVTYDLKPFRQGQRWYLALAMENYRQPFLDPCGIAIVEITNPATPVLLGRYDGVAVGSSAAWCNVHTVQIDTDAQGNGTFLMASARDTFDLRVLDIRDLNAVREAGVYHLHDHPHGGFPNFEGSYVHDSTIVGDRVYVAYWGAGAMILDKRKLEAGAPAEQVALNPPRSIAPADFNVHHSYPTADGNFLFVEAEEQVENGIRLFDIRNPAQPREVLAFDIGEPRAAPHNLLMR